MSDFQRLRLRNVFAAPREIGINSRNIVFPVADVTVPPINPPEGGSLRMSLRSRPIRDMEAYRQYLRDEAPDRTKHQLSTLGKILAGTSGVLEGGLRGVSAGTAHGVGLMERPYNLALEDWERKGGRLGELAKLEYQQGADEAELEIKLADQERKNREQFFKELQTMSGIDVDKAQAANLYDQVASRGLQFQKNEADGQAYIVNTKTGTKTPLGKWLETAGERREGEHGFFLRRHETEQTGRERLERMRQAGDKELESQRQSGRMALAALDHDNRKALEKLKNDLAKKAGLKPSEIQAAYEGAFQQTLDANPELAKQMYDGVDSKGNPIQRQNIDPAVHGMFHEKLKQRMNAMMGIEYAPANPERFREALYGSNQSNQDQPIQVQDPVARQRAIEYLMKNEPTLINHEGAIQKVIEEQSKEQSKEQEENVEPISYQIPNVQPQAEMANLSSGLFSRFGQPINPTPNVVAPRFTDLIRNLPNPYATWLESERARLMRR